MDAAAARRAAAPPHRDGAARGVVRDNFAWSLSAGFTYALAQWGVVVAFTHLGTAEQLGEFALGLAVTAPVMLLARMQLRTLEATDARGAFRTEHYLALMLLNVAVGVLACGAVGWLAGYAPHTLALITLIALAKGAENVSEVYFGALQQQERISFVARSMMLKGALSVTAVWLTLWATRSSTLAAAALGLTWLSVLLLFDVPVNRRVLGRPGPWRRLRQTPRRELLRQVRALLGVAWALGFVALLGTLRPNVPRYVIEAHLGAAALGHYAALAYFAALGGRVVDALIQALSPRLARYHAAGDRRRYGRALGVFVGAAAGVGVCAVAGSLLLGRWALTLVYGRAYAQDVRLFAWLMGAAALEYVGVTLQVALTAARQLKVQMALLTASVGVVALAALAWVPRVGPVGAAWALGVGWLFELTGSALLNLRAWRRLGAVGGGPARAHAEDRGPMDSGPGL